ncbi:MAG: hypothetical protein GX279_09555 [Clostridiaceae bacterium]|nr:hypothetical protein [Clostridiaceae bacterium]
MNKREMYETDPNGFEQATENDQVNSEEMYSMPNEEACSAEFADGCKAVDGQED